MLELTTKLVTLEGDSRLMKAGTNGKTISDSSTGYTATVVQAGRAYAIVLDTSHSSVPMRVIVPAIYDCLTLTFGDEQAASKLGLPPPSINASVPSFSPAVGFYLVQ